MIQLNNRQEDPKIACRGVWKVFGPSPRSLLEQHDRAPDPETLKRKGYIGAVRGANLNVYTGEILVVMGLSGSGKSTLIRCLARLIEPTAGEILLDGKNLLTASEEELIELRRHKMGMVFQHFALLPHRTVLENVAFPLEVQGIARDERIQRAGQVIDLVGLKGREGYYPRELSGGQQQRVGIARSLAVEPDIWFLDEPFSALDPLIRREMQDEFLRLQRMLRKTIVFITHDFDEAIRLADRIAIMYEGEIVQLGTAEELIIDPATDYVAEFTREVPRGRLLSIRSVMEFSGSDSGNLSDATVSADDKVDQAARIVLDQEKPVRVVDKEGAVVGTVRRAHVMDVLFPAKT